MNRKDRALSAINLNGVGLEIGPLDHPMLTKDDSEVYYVDHMSFDELKNKYRDEPVNLEKIVKPDYVLGDKTLQQVTNGNKFDYILASHVIEHIPDITRWLNDIASVLKPNGILSLIIPDGRFTFDIERNISRPADIIGAYLDKHVRATSSSMYDYSMEARDNINASEVWKNPFRDYAKKPFHFTRDEAYKRTLTNSGGKTYVDAHCFVFTPYSFVEVMRCLIDHNLFNFEVVKFEETQENDMEFFVGLQKTKPNKQKQLASLPKLKKPTEFWEVQRDLLDVNTELERIINSRSWKLTKPLRTLKEMVKKKK